MNIVYTVYTVEKYFVLVCLVLDKQPEYCAAFCLSKVLKTLWKLDWANSAPTYPQTGHHSRHRF